MTFKEALLSRQSYNQWQQDATEHLAGPRACWNQWEKQDFSLEKWVERNKNSPTPFLSLILHRLWGKKWSPLNGNGR